MRNKKILALSLAVVLALFTVGCGEDTSSSNKPAETPVVEDVTEGVDNSEEVEDTTDSETETEDDTTENDGSGTVAGDTLGSSYVAAFDGMSETDPNAVVDALMNDVENEMSLVKMDVEPGYLNGFDAEIKGFSKGVTFAPMIGSIPFVGYVFETDDAAALVDELKANANLRWNVCTEADEMVSSVNGNLVFFMMCSNEN